MRTKITRKEMYSRICKNRIIRLGAGRVQNLARFKESDYWFEGELGWNADIYDFGDFAICTGYRPFGTSSAVLSEICDRYNRLFETASEEQGKELLEAFKGEIRAALK